LETISVIQVIDNTDYQFLSLSAVSAANLCKLHLRLCLTLVIFRYFQ